MLPGLFVLMSVITSVLVAGLLKVLVEFFNKKDISLELFFRSGHMPSSHSATVGSLASSIFLIEGFSPLFIASLVFGVIVIYDAMGVRQETGKHARMLNELMKKNKIKIEGEAPDKLYEFVGHTPKEVIAGVVLGILVTISLAYV